MITLGTVGLGHAQIDFSTVWIYPLRPLEQCHRLLIIASISGLISFRK
jgi:hypothetical protein